MGNTISIVIAVFQMLPALIKAMQALEEAIPGTGKGEQKLAAIRGILEQIAGTSAAIIPFVEKACAVLVTVFNAAGVFKTTAPPVAPEQ